MEVCPLYIARLGDISPGHYGHRLCPCARGKYHLVYSCRGIEVERMEELRRCSNDSKDDKGAVTVFWAVTGSADESDPLAGQIQTL